MACRSRAIARTPPGRSPTAPLPTIRRAPTGRPSVGDLHPAGRRRSRAEAPDAIQGWWRHDGPAGAPGASVGASRRSSRSGARGSPGDRHPTSRSPANPHQPGSGSTSRVTSLTPSIADHGVLQPILVTETIDGYQLVAGERRLRAAQAAGLERIPAVVRQLADRDQLELALVENLQREDLDPLETAEAYRQLIEEFGFSQDEVAERVGRARSTVANTLRLLDLAPASRPRSPTAPDRGPRSRARRPRAGAPGPRPRLSSARSCPSGRPRSSSAGCVNPAPSRSGVRAATDPELERVEEDLRRALGTKVSLARSRRGGRIVIEYYSDEELGRLYERLTGGTA